MARVAIVFDCFYPSTHGGAERVYRSLADSFAAKQHEVTFLTRTQWDVNAPPAVSFRLQPVWTGEIYNSKGFRTIRGALAFSFSVFRYFIRNRKKYDLVIVSSTPAFLIPLVRFALAGTQTIIIADWLEVWSLKKWRTYAGNLTGAVGAILQNIALICSPIILVNSQFTQRRVQKLKPNTKIIRLGLFNLTTYESKAEETSLLEIQEGDSTPYGIFVGRIIEDKQLPFLAPVVQLVRKSIPNFKLKVIGSGPDSENAVAAFKNHGVLDSLEFLGRVSDQELDRHFRFSTVHLFPSRREGFGLVVPEAASRGIPTIVNDAEDNAAVELIIDGINGYVSHSQVPEEWAALIELIVSQGNQIRESSSNWFINRVKKENIDNSVEEILVQTGYAL